MRAIPLAAILILITSHAAYSTTSVVNLTCEYAKRPLGIDVKTPRLGWIISTGGARIISKVKSGEYSFKISGK